MSVIAMNSCTGDSPTATMNDRNDSDAPSRGTQNVLQAIGDCQVGLYPHRKLFMPVAVRVRVRQAAAMNKTHLQIRDTEKRPKTMLVTSPQNR